MPELTFNGVACNGQVLRCWLGGLEARDSESELFGLEGVSVIDGGRGKQIVHVRLRILGFATDLALETYRATTLHALLGERGTLVISTGTSAWNKSYADTRFKAIEDGDTIGPMPDVDGTWYQELDLTFHKLSPP